MFFIPKHIAHTLTFVTICAILLAVLLHWYWFVLGVISVFSIREIFRIREKKMVGVWLVALCLDRHNEEKKRWDVIREDIRPPKPFDLEEHISSKHNDLISIFGEMGTGKSYLASYLSWMKIKEQDEKVIVLSPKTFPDGQEHDFFWIQKKYDVSKKIPNPFTPERLPALVNSLQVCFVSQIRNLGITAVNIRPLLNKIVEKKPKSWQDVYNTIRELKREQPKLEMALDTIRNIISQVDLPISEEVISFDESCLLELGGFGENAHIQKEFFLELWCNIIFQQCSRRGLRDVILCVDESHYLLKWAEQGSCLNYILRMGRLAFSLMLCSQHLSDVHKDLRQTGSVFEFYTTHEDTFDYLKSVRPFMGDCLRLLRKNEFIDLKQEFDSKDKIGEILKVDDVRFEEFLSRAREQQENVVGVSTMQQEDIVITPENEVITNSPQKEKPSEKKFDREDVESSVVSTIEESPLGLWKNEVMRKVGFTDRDDARRATISKLFEKLAEDGKIRVEDYVTPRLKKGLKPRRLWITGKNEDRAETQLHRRGLEDCKDVFKIEKLEFQEGKINQGFDFTLSFCHVEAETGFKKSLGEFDKKIDNADKKVIVILPNEQVRERYSFLPTANSGKCVLVLLNEMAEMLRSLRNEQDTTT